MLLARSLVVEVMDHKKNVYLDRNDGVTGFGITTNEPTFDWHVENINHYEWKRSLARQSIAIPGNWLVNTYLICGANDLQCCCQVPRGTISARSHGEEWHVNVH
jgi:penicillin V acylase-like amidase (Ntn superfamily)